jgi:hypothetical protein
MLLDQGDDAKKGDEKEHVTLAAWRRGGVATARI